MTQAELHQLGMTDEDLERRYLAACGAPIEIDRRNPDSPDARLTRRSAHRQMVIGETAVLADTSDLAPCKPLGAFAVDDPETHRSFKSK